LERLHGRQLNPAFAKLAAYLRDDTLEVMADNLGSTQEWLLDHLRHYFGKPPSLPQLRQWFRGGRQLPRPIGERLWALIERCGLRPRFRDHLRRRRLDHELYLDLLGRHVTTLTGRVRGRLLFSEARQAEYRDLADDAAKSATFALAAGGFPVVAVAGGAVVTYAPPTPDAGGDARPAQEVARRAAEEVLQPVPAACEACGADHW
jgi:hypothetical protein